MNTRALCYGLLVLLTLLGLACGGLPGGNTPVAPTRQPTTAPTVAAGLVAQWAVEAAASSEHGDPQWAARQATGEPNTSTCGDNTSAWAAAFADTDGEWLELSYTQPVFPTEVRIYETYHPGGIVRVELISTVSEYITIWEGQPRAVEECPRVFSIPVSDVETPITGLRITLDQSVIGDWSEIDAVQLLGRPAPVD